jgi:hypothetical protein
MEDDEKGIRRPHSFISTLSQSNTPHLILVLNVYFFAVSPKFISPAVVPNPLCSSSIVRNPFISALAVSQGRQRGCY